MDYSFNYTLSQPADLQDKVDSYTAAHYVNRGLEYDGRAPQYTPEDLELFRNGKDPQGHANVDWQDITMRNFAPEMRHNLTLTGGSETMKIYTGLGYYNQESIYRTNSNNMQRYNFRTNVEAILKNIGLKATVIDGSQCPDIIPVLSVVAALAQGTTKIIKAGRLRIKECDRLKAVASELTKLGAKIEEKEDGLIIEGVESLKGGVEVWSWKDHRIAMTLAIAATRCEEPIILKDYECISKSYPSFFDDYRRLGGIASEWNVGK